MITPLIVSVSENRLAQALHDLMPSLDIVRWDLSGPAPREHIDIVVPDYLAPTSRLAQLTGVDTRLVQSQSIGYDGVGAVLPSGVLYANASSVHEASTAELAVALILASQRGLKHFLAVSERGEWSFTFHESLADRTVLLLGYGGVGCAIASRLAPFEVNMIRVARGARFQADQQVHSWTELPDLLPRSDIVVISLPLTTETTRLVDDEFLSRMTDHSLLVNVGRGAVVDTDAMLREATRGRLRFALDVVDPEPLPSGHPLFSLDNVIITPHVGGASSAMFPRVLQLISTQIERLARGEEPLNVVLRT